MVLMRSWVDIEEGRRRKECLFCDDECESFCHDCPVYDSLRNDFMCTLQEVLRDRFEHF